MMDHPLLCNSQVVRNILAGRQTQDRRPIKPQPPQDIEYWKCTPRDWSGWKKADNAYGEVEVYPCNMFSGIKSPFGNPGDVLWVRETLSVERELPDRLYFDVLYSADKSHFDENRNITTGNREKHTEWFMSYKNWWNANKDKVIVPNIHMPKWACRLRRPVKRVWVEQVQSISLEDIRAEGLVFDAKCDGSIMRTGFRNFWDSIYPGSWDRNDWLWCCEFEAEQ